MRKETIIKYEKEFLAWCKGESVLLGAPTSMHDRTLIWREVRDFNDWKPLDTVYVLNDSYYIYRKALAEGKTLQYNFGNYGINKKDFPDSWKDLDLSIGILADRTCPENYRIKPEESKFKVGDWVKTIDGAVIKLDWVDKPGVLSNLYDYGIFGKDNCKLSYQNEVTSWQPQPDEPQFKVGDWVRDKKRKYKPFMVTSSDLEADSPNYVKIDCELWQPQPGELVILEDKNSIISIIKYNGETNVYPFIGEITWLHKKD